MLFFFFKQKTAYEMRISDWSSDVCSSDLRPFSIRCFAGRICQGRGCRTEQNGNIFSSRAGTVQHRSTVQCSTQYIDSYMIALGDRLVTFSELDGTIEVVQRNDMDEVKIEQDPDGEIAPLDQQEDEEDVLGSNGLTRFDAAISSTDWTTETVISQLRKGNIFLDPDFQRRDAWTVQRKSQYIESLILGIPTPQIILAERKEKRGSYLVIDGKQRLLSLRQFSASANDKEFRSEEHTSELQSLMRISYA